jgi:hypothetical protein
MGVNERQLMSNDELIFVVALEVNEMKSEVDRLWQGQALDGDALARLTRLMESGRKVNSALIALRQRALGVPAPKVGE